MKDNFFIPWHENFIKGKEYRKITGKFQHSYKQNYFGITRGQNVKWWNKPYFAITNENSTVKFFLDALIGAENGIGGADDKEAAVYMSKDRKFELEDIKNIFNGMRNYKYACKLADARYADFATVTISPTYEGRKNNSLITVKMVYEPNRYGKWKIYKIEETLI